MTGITLSELPPIQYGLAERLRPAPNYAELPIEQAFENLNDLLPHLPRGEALAAVDGTAFYSRMREDLTEEQILDNEVVDEAALEAAISAGGILAYFRGHRLHNRDTGVGPYPDFKFKPSGVSACLWLTGQHARKGTATPEHTDPAGRVEEWYVKKNFKIVKFAVTIARSGEDGGESVAFRRVPRIKK